MIGSDASTSWGGLKLLDSGLCGVMWNAVSAGMSIRLLGGASLRLVPGTVSLLAVY